MHDGPQQRLVALAVSLQVARQLVDDDPPAARTLLDEIGRDVQEALEETRKLAHRIYPPVLEAGGLGVALRMAAASIGARTDVQVATGEACPPEVAGTVYFCCLGALELIGTGATSTISVHEEEAALAFEIIESGSGSGVVTAAAGLAGIQERVESLGGWLTITSEPGRGARISGSLPMSR